MARPDAKATPAPGGSVTYADVYPAGVQSIDVGFPWRGRAGARAEGIAIT